MDEPIKLVRKMKKTDSKPARHKQGNAVMAMSQFADGGSSAATQATVISIDSNQSNTTPTGGMNMDANAVKHVLEERRRLDEKLRKQREELEELRGLKEQKNEIEKQKKLLLQKEEEVKRQQMLLKYPPPPMEDAPPPQPPPAQTQTQTQTQAQIHHPIQPPPPQQRQQQQQHPNPLPQYQQHRPLHVSTGNINPPQTPPTQLLTANMIKSQLNNLPSFDSPIPIPQLLWDGVTFHKYPFNTTGGNPKQRMFRLKHGKKDEPGTEIIVRGGGYDNYFVDKYQQQGVLKMAHLPLTLEWYDSKKGPSKKADKSLPLDEIYEIKRGHQTPTFWSFAASRGVGGMHHMSVCFSLNGDERTVDVGCDTKEQMEAFLQALGGVMRWVKEQRANPNETNVDYGEDVEGAHVSNAPYNEAEDKGKLFAAIKTDDLEMVKFHLDQKNCPIDIMDDFSGDTALISACRLGRIDIVNLALERGARNDPHPEFGQTALQSAVSAGHANCVKVILETAAPSHSDLVIVNHEDFNKEAPIHVASRCGNFPVLELLVEHGANMYLVDKNGRTCLHCACMGGHKQCLSYLLDAGGDAILEERDHAGRTCLHLAINGNKIECVRLLLETAADVKAVTPEGLTCYRIAVKRNYHTLARLIKEYDRLRDGGALNSNWDDDRSAYTSNSDAEGLSDRGSLPRPHKSASSPSVASLSSKKSNQNSGGSNGRNLIVSKTSGSFDFSTLASPTMGGGGGQVWSSQGSTPHTPHMMHGLDTYDVSAGQLTARNNNNQYPNYHNKGSSAGGYGSGYGSGYESPYAGSRHQNQPQQQFPPQQYPPQAQPQQYNYHQQYNPQLSARELVRGVSWNGPTPAPNPTGYASDAGVNYHNNNRRHLMHTQSASPTMLHRAHTTGAQQRNHNIYHHQGVDYQSDSGYSNHQQQQMQGYTSDYTPQTHNQHNNAQGGYNSDTSYSHSQSQRTKQSVSPPPPIISPQPTQPEPVVRVDSGRSVVSAITLDDEMVNREIVVNVPGGADGVEEDAYVDAGGFGDVESFYIGVDLWNVYESDGYPYYLRMRDNFSQWDDPRVVGVEDEGQVEGHEEHHEEHTHEEEEEEEEEQFEEPVAEEKEFEHHHHHMEEKLLSKPQETSSKEVAPTPTPPQAIIEEQLMSPTGTSSQRAGVGATFINVNRTSKLVPQRPIHAETKNAPLVRSQSSISSLSESPNKREMKDSVEEDVFEEPLEEVEDKSMAEAKEESPPPSKSELKASLMKNLKMAPPPNPPPSRPAPAPVPAHTSTSAPTPTISKADLKNDPVLNKYVKMASVGVPAANVLLKIKNDAISADKIDLFCSAFNIEQKKEVEKKKAPAVYTDSENDSSSSEESSGESPQPTILSKEELSNDEDLAKYVKMTKMGIPPPAVVQKMKKDSIAADKVFAFELTFGLATSASNKKKKKSKRDKNNLTPSRRTSVKMQQIHMNKVSEDRLQGSLWAGGEGEDDLAKDDIAALEQAFGRQSVSPGLAASGKKSVEKKEVSLVDPKRAYNVCIALAQFRSGFAEDWRKLVNAVVAFDEKSLSLEKVNNLKVLLPTERELRDVMSFKGDVKKLGKCESFFRAVCEVDGVASLCEAFSAILGFKESAEDVKHKLKMIGSACDRIVGSKNLGVLMKKVLAVGNLMNESIGRPKVSGIRLESLLKLSLTKGTDRKTTVIDLVVQMIAGEGKQGEETLLIGEELRGIESGARVKSVKTLVKSIEEIKDGVTVVEKCGERAGVKGQEFLAYARREVQGLDVDLETCQQKVEVLCNFFAEDSKVVEASNIIGVLLNFSRLVATSLESYRRKQRRKEIDAAREANKRGGGRGNAGGGGSQFASVRGDSDRRPPPTQQNQHHTPTSRSTSAQSTPERRHSNTNANQFNQDLLKQALAERRFSVAGEEKDGRNEGKNAHGDDSSDSDDWLDADETNGD
ncbi:hypothetical protein TrLO_g11614 [Triparma laevis f. longispina]|uniref:FH2 domain-containing protein n=1 Tax=Triparma laevis f. longispina TaxID=1714387 RepID=A0A9W7CK41_9STRA|nr:hypothetical protein TrLO_g11614 [Triparma laevis f. longispina]